MLSPQEHTVADKLVRLFHASLVWPLQIEPLPDTRSRGRHWEAFERSEQARAWRRIDDEFTDDPSGFHERHYREFVSFLPYVQRFLYGEARSAQGSADPQVGRSPMHIFRRNDITGLRLTLHEGQTPIELHIVHIDLYFFDDLDLVQLNLEVNAHDLPLDTARDVLFRFGRAYPSGWEEGGDGLHNAHLAEWLGPDGQVVARSDTQRREKYLSYVCQHRSPCISEHWARLLRPLVLAHSEEPGELRFRLIEYHRMPVMAYLALERPTSLTADDWVRLGLASQLHPEEAVPVNDPSVKEFDQRYCQDRFWTGLRSGPHTRFICTGNSLTVVGDANLPFFVDGERGVLAQFRHQYFLIFLIAHLHRASLLVFSDVLIGAVNALNIRDDDSVRLFKRRIRANFETFLRFTHRYWFHELSERPHVQATFRMCSNHLRNDALYEEVRDEIREMSQYLDSDSQRRQSNTVVRLTVITILGLIATVTTGYFGMNIIAFGDAPVSERVLHGLVATAVFVALVLYAVSRSQRLSAFLEAMSNERLSFGGKLSAFWKVFGKRKP
ncbi:CorA family divalent cation transporter [Rhodoferax sp. BLA1]|uniref:CorA family divalent cation transporter n=1 Tax=Rhodoferax sp. BLA1 TaxID=2576062 RepID=UPI0015D12CF9|nr:CorA family divalent cation transporter [Rhodoferax sp. BLA1]